MQTIKTKFIIVEALIKSEIDVKCIRAAHELEKRINNLEIKTNEGIFNKRGKN